MINCAVVGATGYTGIELVKILLRHPYVQLTALTTRQKESVPLHQLIPSLPHTTNKVVRRYSFSEIRRDAEVVFLCLPHTEAMQDAARYFGAGKIVIDLSADLRLRQAGLYEKWYGVRHLRKNLLKKAVYGLPEVYRKKIKTSRLIANPGCYPTVSILSLVPLIKEKLIDTDSIIIDAKSGVSGAGKKVSAGTQFCAVDENFYAYKVNRHQHTPEIEQSLSDVAGRKIQVTFTPHLLPLDRGILATVYVRRKKGVTEPRIREAYRSIYEKEPFIRVKPAGSFPALRDVQGTNFCDIGISADPRSGWVTVIAAIDNLVKGASGQAVQNMNIRCGFAEDEGLKTW